jgi:hypothetical protein
LTFIELPHVGPTNRKPGTYSNTHLFLVEQNGSIS